MRQGVVLPETPRDRRNLDGLEQDVRDSPLRGRPLRLRSFRPDAGSYLASLDGPRPYMARLREIAALTAAHEQALAEAYAALGGDAAAWATVVEGWDFGDVNELIDRHNRWYPAESRLPMDPRTGDYALVNGRSYRREPLGRGVGRSSASRRQQRDQAEAWRRAGRGGRRRRASASTPASDGPLMFPSAQAVFMIPNPIACDSPASSVRSETSAIPGV